MRTRPKRRIKRRFTTIWPARKDAWQKLELRAGANAEKATNKKPPGSSFKKWRDGEMNSGYPVDIAPVNFSRYMDRASTVLLQHTIRRTSFDSCTVIKRKAAGSKSSGEVYLRFDFTGVMITKVSWSDDLPIKEDYDFICRAVTVSYRPQLPDGTLGAVIPGFWTMSGSGLTQVNLRGD